MNLEDLIRVQEIDTELLFLVDDICKKHDIQYFLFYGTLLGAVRHGGPIPWDDDVDIAMTRENYLKFASIASCEIDSEKYNFKIMGSGDIKYVSEIKIGKKGTVFCMPGTENIDIMNQVQLDIFCLNSCKQLSDRKFYMLKRLWNVMSLIKLNASEKLLLKFCIDKSDRKLKFLYKALLDVCHAIRFVVGERTIEKLGYKLFVDESAQSDVMMVFQDDVRYKTEWLSSQKCMNYAGKKLPVPCGYDVCLSMEYGDYMQFPPEDKRLRNGFDEWVFFDNN